MGNNHKNIDRNIDTYKNYHLIHERYETKEISCTSICRNERVNDWWNVSLTSYQEVAVESILYPSAERDVSGRHIAQGPILIDDLSSPGGNRLKQIIICLIIRN